MRVKLAQNNKCKAYRYCFDFVFNIVWRSTRWKNIWTVHSLFLRSRLFNFGDWTEWKAISSGIIHDDVTSKWNSRAAQIWFETIFHSRNQDWLIVTVVTELSRVQFCRKSYTMLWFQNGKSALRKFDLNWQDLRPKLYNRKFNCHFITCILKLLDLIIWVKDIGQYLYFIDPIVC